MCEALRELMKDEIAEREQKTEEKARQENSMELIRNLMETMKITAEQAMEALKVPVKDRKKYMAGLQ